MYKSDSVIDRTILFFGAYKTVTAHKPTGEMRHEYATNEKCQMWTERLREFRTFRKSLEIR